MNRKNRWNDTRLSSIVGVMFFIVPFAFMLHTQHAWEDWYITYRASKNLATGNGFVFVPGERLHTYTSPIGALIPALLNLVTGNTSDELVLFLYGTIGCLNFALLGILFFKIGRALRLSYIPMLFLLGMIVFDAKSIDFSINGMETSFLLLCFSYLVWIHLTQSQSRWYAVHLGIAWAGFMWTRPDGFIYVAAISGVQFLLPTTTDHAPIDDRKVALRKYLIGAAIASAIYLPWIIWAWSYYGSPVPNTIVAKGVNSEPPSVIDLLQTTFLFPVKAFSLPVIADIFSPSYALFGGWPAVVTGASSLATLIACTLWMVPGFARVGRAFSLTALLILVYLSVIPFPYPWYIPGGTMACVLALAVFWQEILAIGTAASPRFTHWADANTYKILTRGIPSLHVLLAFFLLLASGKQLKAHQTLIEDGIRRPLGLWLKENSDPKRDRVFIECLGYVGFYSNLKMLDYPGLSSTEVIEARRRVGNNFGSIIRELSPEWVVLRPSEASRLLKSDMQKYTLAATFNNREAILGEPNIPGINYLLHDATFLVFRRTDLLQAKL
jgi:hypothetical protein